jgi:hypothetical protein
MVEKLKGSMALRPYPQYSAPEASMTPDEKVRAIEARINACMRGQVQPPVIVCPFCGGENRKENDRLCCPDFALVVRAVLRKQAQQQGIDQAKRIADRLADMAAMN